MRCYPNYVVVGVAGSLNSVGCDESNHREQDNNTEPDRIVQLGYYNNDNLQIIPLGQVAQNLQNMSNVDDPISPAGNYGRERRGTKGIHLPLAKELLKYVPSDYKILVVPVAYGATGFSSGDNLAYDDVTKKPSVNPQGGNWSLNGAYYMTLRDRIKYALDLNPENKFLGVIWCQGESDANAQVEALKTGFQALVNQLATDWANYVDRTINNAVDKSIWYVYETASHWRNTCSQVWKWYKEYLGDSNYIVVAPRAYYTNQENGASSGQGQTPYNRLATYGNNSFITIVAQNVANKLVENKAIYGQLDTQVTNFVGNRQFVDKYWNPYKNSIEASEIDNSITFVQCVSSRTPAGTSFTLKDNVKELVLTNIKAGVIILLEHTAQGDYSGIVFNNQNAGNNNSNYTTVRGITDGNRLDDGFWDNNNIANNITVPQKNFTNGRTKIKQISRGVYKFYFNDVEWFDVDLTTNVASLKQNGINESDIIYSVGLMYGWTYSHNTSVIANLSDVVVEAQVTP